MKRLFTFVLSALIVAFFTSVHAQQNIFIWKNGEISVKSVSHIDSITTCISSRLFTIQTLAATSVTTNKIEASISLCYADNVQSFSPSPEVGICYSSEKTAPTYADEHIRLGSSAGNYKFVLYDIDPGTTYYYCAYVKFGKDIFYGNVKSIMTFGEKPQKIIINGHKFVDLGLPSGLLWAKTNVGAASSEKSGNYFAWGETESKPYNEYLSGYYKWDWENPSKYNSSDGKVILDPDDDAATVNWGAPCRMPSSSEFLELCTQCNWTWISNGFLVTGPNDNTIFLPASGFVRTSNGVSDSGLGGYYWSRSIHSNSIYYADILRFLSYGDNKVEPLWSELRYCGAPVRPVAEK